MTTSRELGQFMQLHALALRGGSAVDDEMLLERVAQRIGMHPVGPAARWDYPTKHGAGGVGRTTILPITESFLAVDSWPMLGGRYLVVCSCQAFDATELGKLVASEGLDIQGRLGGLIGLGDGPDGL